MMQREVLVVGAGITGSLTASFIGRASNGNNITVWDKARGSGGRFSTNRLTSDPSQHVDMGAQYITRNIATSNETKVKGHLYDELLSKSLLTPFQGLIEGGKHDRDTVNYVAAEGMSSICKYFLNTPPHTTVLYKQCLKNVDVTGNKITCHNESGQREAFDALVLTLPVPLLLQLEGSIQSLLTSEIRSNMSAVKYSSRYALGLFYDSTTVRSSPGVFQSRWTAKYFDDPVVRFACWDNLKRGVSINREARSLNREAGVSVNRVDDIERSSNRETGATLLVHTTVQFGSEHLDTDKDKVEEAISHSLDKLIPNLPNAVHSHIVCWRYSQVWDMFPGSHDCLVLSHDPLIVATGDSFTGSNFENCLQAALTTADIVLGNDTKL